MVNRRNSVSPNSPRVIRLEIYGWWNDHRNRVSPVRSVIVVMPRTVGVVPIGSAIPMAVMVAASGRTGCVHCGEQNGE